MNRKQLIFVLVALAILGTAGWVLYRQHQQSWNQLGARMGDKVLPNFHPNDVAAIHIKGATEINIVHQNDLWRVAERNDYPANFSKISDSLLKLQGLKIVEAETVGPSQLSRVNLNEPGRGLDSGTLVEFKDAQGKLLQAILLGKKHAKDQGEVSHALVSSEPDGRYILLREDPATVLLISDALAGLEPRPEAWLNKDFIKIENIKSISHTAADPANSWKISRESPSADWVLAEAKPGETLDTRRASIMADMLKSPSFSDVSPAAADLTGSGLEKDPSVASIETFDHFAYTLKIGAKMVDESFPVIIRVTAELSTGKGESADAQKKLRDKLRQEQALSAWVFKVNAWLIEPLVHDRAQILEGYKDTNATDTAAAPQKPKSSWTPRVIQ